jgi:hypothetical protein
LFTEPLETNQSGREIHHFLGGLAIYNKSIIKGLDRTKAKLP